MDKSYVYTRRDLWTVEQTLEAAIDERDAALTEVEQVNRRFENLSASTSAMLVNAEAEITRLRAEVAELQASMTIDVVRAQAKEVERLRAQVEAMREDVAFMLRTPHNHDWLPRYDCQRCAVEERLAGEAGLEGGA